MREKIEVVKAWIKKAENDLTNAKHVVKIKTSPPLDTVCFHAQQWTQLKWRRR